MDAFYKKQYLIRFTVVDDEDPANGSVYDTLKEAVANLDAKTTPSDWVLKLLISEA